MSIRPLAVALGLSVLVVGSSLAAARAPDGRSGRLAACQKEFDTFCANIERGKGRRLQCLKDNAASLSPDCKTALDAVVAARAAREQKGTAPANQ